MSGGGGEFENPPASPFYSLQPSDSEEDEEDMDVDNDVPDEIDRMVGERGDRAERAGAF